RDSTALLSASRCLKSLSACQSEPIRATVTERLRVPSLTAAGGRTRTLRRRRWRRRRGRA
ncbi:Hypothetical predicted protein, partial [Scomber scombrus]